MSAVFELARGGSAVLLETDGDRVTVLSSAPSPPGSTLELTLEAARYRIKVRGCKRGDADAAGRAFRIDGRWVSLEREQRERVLSAAASGREHQT